MADPSVPDLTEAYREAGLWDPDSDGPAGQPGRLELLRTLTARGVTIERIASTRESDLIGLSFDMVVESGTLTLAELAQRCSMSEEVLASMYRDLGVELEGDHGALFEEDEVHLVELLAAISEAFPEQAGREVFRSIDTALSTMSAAAISAFVGTVETDLERAGDEVEWSATVAGIGELGLEISASLRPLFRHHLRAGIAHQRVAMGRAEERPLSELSVGFVDLVGYTTRTSDMDTDELIDFTSRFRTRAHDVVADYHGRIVKHIGDEIMFSALHADDACRIALSLVDSFGEAGSKPRGGVAHGPMVARHGDLYGPLVNLASRLTDAAVPGEVLAPAEIAAVLTEDSRVTLVAAGRRQLKGFGDPVAVVSVELPD